MYQINFYQPTVVCILGLIYVNLNVFYKYASPHSRITSVRSRVSNLSSESLRKDVAHVRSPWGSEYPLIETAGGIAHLECVQVVLWYEMTHICVDYGELC